MFQVIEWMLDDVNTVASQSSDGRVRLLELCQLSQQRLRLVEIKLLGWLERQSRSDSEITLSLAQGFPWCDEVSDFVRCTEGLGGIVSIHGDELALSPQLSAVGRTELLARVAEGYPLRTMT